MKTLTLLALAGSLAVPFMGCEPGPGTAFPGDRSHAVSGAVDAAGVRTIRITPAGNEMRFRETAIAATAGETLRVVFENTATSPAMSHNVLFVADRESIHPVGRAAMGAADRDYIPDHPAVIASTPMAAPGETVEVTFTVPAEPGEYPYICTYPGHYLVMQGVLFVDRPGAD
jgi:azurin